MEEFVPYEENKVSMYTCGPTVYNYAHIGNLRTYIHEDILEKSLKFLGYEVNRVMNITDVGHLESDADDGEDKMLKGAQRENKTVWEVAQYYTDAFFKDCDVLHIQKPNTIAKATDYISAYIHFIQGLEAKGFTYFTNGNVYFDISKVETYTILSKVNLEDLRVAHRDGVEEDTHKKNPQDFVLWFTKSKFDNQAMKWESPWGIGYPGWHIECSVIALENLGESLDIHCGGIDHIPVHHTNEIAQTESFTGKPWTKYWWHSEFLIDNSGKMSKSSGEFLTVDLLVKKGFDPLAYRYYVLNSHYRKQLTFSFESLEMAQSAYQKLIRRVRAVGDPTTACEVKSERGLKLLSDFRAYLEDDLNTANAITVLYDVLKADIDIPEKLTLIKELDTVLSLGLFATLKVEDQNKEDIEWIEDLLMKRTAAKAEKNWALADEIRDVLKEKGIHIIDKPEGATWKRDN
jgi:cysteinyl-tRNA synthetase